MAKGKSPGEKHLGMKILFQGSHETFAGELRLVKVDDHRFVIERETTESDATQTITAHWRQVREITANDYELLWLCRNIAKAQDEDP